MIRLGARAALRSFCHCSEANPTHYPSLPPTPPWRTRCRAPPSPPTRQIQLYAQRQLAIALTHESPTELEFACLATLKAVVLAQGVRSRCPAHKPARGGFFEGIQ